MKQLTAKIVENKKITEDFYRIRIGSAYLAKSAKPGQFVEIKCSEGCEPLLRRPLGIHRVAGNKVDLLYEVVGQGTRLLSQKKEDELLDVIGPLGNGFEIPAGRNTVVLVAGGNGVAPLLFLADELTAKKQNVHVLVGARSKTHILCENDFKRLDAKVSIATEDGSKGHRGFITDLLADLLHKMPNAGKAAIYACGPTGMLKAVSEIADNYSIACQVSLEERMACGVGACLGCPVKVKKHNEYRMVCKDGPVFNAEDIEW